MATNEIYKYGQWISLPLPLKGTDPTKNDDPTRNGDPVLIGDIVGVAQEVGGVPVEVSVGLVTYGYSRNTANHLEPGWASIALCGAWAFTVADAVDPEGATPTPMGTTINITGATAEVPGPPVVPAKAATLTVAAGDKPFGHLIGWTKDNPKRAIVDIVQSFSSGGSAAPVAVTNLSADTPAPTDDVVTLTWEWAQGSGEPATSFSVRYRTTPSGAWSTPQTVPVGTSPYTLPISGLEPSTSYTFEVVAVGAEANSAPSTVVKSTAATPPVPITALTTNNPVPTDDTIVLTWSWDQGSGGPADGYEVQWRTPAGTGTYGPISAVTPNTVKTLTVDGLTPNTEYEFKVAAFGPGGTKSTEVTATETTAQAAPVAPTALVTNTPAPTADTIVLSWTWDQGSGGPATGYKVQWRTPPTTGTYNTAQSVTPSTNKTFSATGLTANTEYEFSVVATGAGGDSSALTGTQTTAAA